MRLSLKWGALVLVAGWLALGSSLTAEAQVCEPRCRMGSTCVNGTCVADTRSACEPRCRMGSTCVNGTCVSETAPSCNPPCGEGSTCNAGVCEPVPGACVPACAAGMSCVDGRCEVPPDPACEPACAEGQACVNGSCQALFVDDPCATCPAGSVCENGTCRRGPPDCPAGQRYEPAAGCMPTGGEIVPDCGGACDPAYCVEGRCELPVDDGCGGNCHEGEVCVQNACAAADDSWENDPGLNARLHLALGGTYGWFGGVSFAGQLAIGGGGEYVAIGFRLAGGRGENTSTDDAGWAFPSLELGWRHMRGSGGIGLTLAALLGYGRMIENSDDGSARYRVPYLRLGVGILGTRPERSAWGVELSGAIGFMGNYERDEVVGRLEVVRTERVNAMYGDVTLALVLTL